MRGRAATVAAVGRTMLGAGMRHVVVRDGAGVFNIVCLDVVLDALLT